MPIDLRKIRLPVYLLSTREDHIAPWTSTYAATQIYRGKTTFVLAGSGHIAGVINPPSVQKYGFGPTPSCRPIPRTGWAARPTIPGRGGRTGATGTPAFAGKLVPARQPGAGKLKPLEDAPGSYARKRVV